MRSQKNPNQHTRKQVISSILQFAVAEFSTK